MLELKDICVNYSYKKVLKGINVTFNHGRIYSLLGENGAGKSTLAHVICGDIKASSGQILKNGKELVFDSPKSAIQEGIVCVHQRPLLSPSISIKDNLKIGIPKSQFPLMENLLSFWLPDHNLKTLVKELDQEECFYVSLTGALMKKPSLLILDEPPAIPLEKLRKLTESGLSIIMITHDLKEALSKSDQIILLQEGVIVENDDSKNFTEESIRSKLYGISKEVKLPESIILQNISENSIKRQDDKIEVIPSDKTFTASNPELSILQLLTAFNPKGKQKDLEKKAKEILKKAGVNIKISEKVRALSGGMLQKLILERAIDKKTEKLYLFKPTQGLDVEATERLYKRLDGLTKEGTQVIISEKREEKK